MRSDWLMSCALGLLLLGGCVRSEGDGGGSLPGVRVPVAESRAGTSYRQELLSRVDGEAIVFQVFEPAQLVAGGSYPLVLHGHGYGDSRITAVTGFVERLVNAGYYVISMDQRGFGEAGGLVRVLSPDYEGQDLIQILDWAEDLPGLKRRASGAMLVGSYGGSYGGIYQFLLAGADPQHRLRVLAPDITPHDISYVLNPNNVLKSGYALALAANGELASLRSGQLLTRPGPGQDLTIYETLVLSALANRFGETALNYFQYTARVISATACRRGRSPSCSARRIRWRCRPRLIRRWTCC